MGNMDDLLHDIGPEHLNHDGKERTVNVQGRSGNTIEVASTEMSPEFLKQLREHMARDAE